MELRRTNLLRLRRGWRSRGCWRRGWHRRRSRSCADSWGRGRRWCRRWLHRLRCLGGRSWGGFHFGCWRWSRLHFGWLCFSRFGGSCLWLGLGRLRISRLGGNDRSRSWCAGGSSRGWSCGSCFLVGLAHQLGSRGAVISFGHKDGQNEGEKEQQTTEPSRDFLEDVGCLRACELIHDAAAECRSKTFLPRALHEDNENEKQAVDDHQKFE